MFGPWLLLVVIALAVLLVLYFRQEKCDRCRAVLPRNGATVCVKCGTNRGTLSGGWKKL